MYRGLGRGNCLVHLLYVVQPALTPLLQPEYQVGVTDVSNSARQMCVSITEMITVILLLKTL